MIGRLNAGDSMRLLTGLALIGLLAAPLPAHAAQKDYNGKWRIYATTEKGQCVKGFRLSIRISRGKAYMIGNSLSGTKTAISSRGQVNIKYVNGRDVITATGRLRGEYGAGSWSYPEFRCTGRWRAERL
jgi:hypothetical protein